MQEQAFAPPDRSPIGKTHRLLVVHEGGEQRSTFLESLLGHLERAQVHEARDIAAARQMLEREAYDVVIIVTGPVLKLDPALIAGSWPKETPILVVADGKGSFDVIEGYYIRSLQQGEGFASLSFAEALQEILESAGELGSGGSSGLSQAEIDRIRAAVVRVSHEIKNPLSIISGNAQLLAELARMGSLDEDLMQPIRDIEEASQRVSGMLHKIHELAALFPAGKRS
jgi:signal transduction histidine kinase